VCVGVCVHACVCVCVGVYVCARMCVCVGACAYMTDYMHVCKSL